jgi:hypothetical protein
VIAQFFAGNRLPGMFEKKPKNSQGLRLNSYERSVAQELAGFRIELEILEAYLPVAIRTQKEIRSVPFEFRAIGPFSLPRGYRVYLSGKQADLVLI